jgi:cytochrome b561
MAQTYDPVARIFHWLIVALLVAQYTVGSIMPHIGRHTVDETWVAWHFDIGAAMLLVIVLRFGWRLLHPVAPAPGLAPWESLVSRFTHYTLYGLIFVMTILGWIAANAHGFDVYLLGLKLPALAPNHAGWGHECGDIHNVLVYVLLGFIILHVAGALYHRFIKRDDVMQRMLP